MSDSRRSRLGRTLVINWVEGTRDERSHTSRLEDKEFKRERTAVHGLPPRALVCRPPDPVAPVGRRFLFHSDPPQKQRQYSRALTKLIKRVR